jgi:hypothetical protein
VAAGLIAGFFTGRFTQSLLFEVKVTDAQMVAIPVFLLLSAGLPGGSSAGNSGDTDRSCRNTSRLNALSQIVAHAMSVPKRVGFGKGGSS